MDVARAVSVLAIILFHFLIWVYFPGMHERSPSLVGVWEKVADFTSTFRLPLLFMISGFLAGPRIRDGFANRKNVLSAATNAWLYVVWLSVFAICSIVIKPGLPLRVGSVDSYFKQLILPRTIVWFIFALVLWTLVLSLLRRVPPGLLLAATFVLSCTIWYAPRPSGEMYVQVLYYGFFFTLGVYAPRIIRWLAAKPVWAKLLLSTVLLAVAIYLIPLIPRDVAGVGSVLRTVKDSLVAGAALPVAALVAFTPLLGKALAYIGRRTLPLYVMQLPILWAVIMVRPRMPWGTSAFQVLSPFIGLAGVVIAALALHWILVRTPARVLFELPTMFSRWIRGKTMQS